MDLVEEGDDERLSETVRLLLQITREKVDGGDGDGALAAVLHAIRLTRGEGAILGEWAIFLLLDPKWSELLCPFRYS